MQPKRNNDGRRSKQVANAIRAEVINIARQELHDHRLDKIGVQMITFSGLDLAPDHRNATVWVSFMGRDSESNEVKDAIAALNHSSPYIHRLLIKRLPMKVHPHLLFKYDPSFDRAANLQPAFSEAAKLEEETARTRKENPENSSDEEK